MFTHQGSMLSCVQKPLFLLLFFLETVLFTWASIRGDISVLRQTSTHLALGCMKLRRRKESKATSSLIPHLYIYACGAVAPGLDVAKGNDTGTLARFGPDIGVHHPTAAATAQLTFGIAAHLVICWLERRPALRITVRDGSVLIRPFTNLLDTSNPAGICTIIPNLCFEYRGSILKSYMLAHVGDYLAVTKRSILV